MFFPKVIIEKDKKRYVLVAIGVLMLVIFIAVNIVLRKIINKKKEDLIITQKRFLVLQKQSLKPEFTKTIKLDSQCPGEQAGNPSANLTIKYFYSPVCLWCILEDQHFDELLKKEGQAFKLEKYNREDCDAVMQKYKLSLTPSFVFSTKNNSQEYTIDGYISKENLIKVICDVTGYCLKDDGKSKNNSIQKSQKIKINFQ